MAVDQRIRNDDIGTVLADRLDDRQLVTFVVTKKAIAQTEVFASRKSKYFGRTGGFFITRLRCAARTQLSSGEVDNPHAFSHLNMLCNGTPTAQLCIIRMHGDD